MKEKRWRIVSSAVGTLFLVMICLTAFIVLSSRLSGGEPTFLGYQVKAVLSGSMEPTFQTGSIISIKLGDMQTSYQKGDIITFRMEGKLITHRITEVIQENGQALYKTKGDHNNGPDLWTVPQSAIIGKYTNLTIPYIGYVLNYAHSKAGSALLMIVPGILLLVSSFRSILVAKNELEGSKA
ncbi:signal peptidase I [Rossellomorea vietnamensis]|uniref:Signal peptidase I n=1 Tax=Rossellomorea vietnamensis TaxID=218284 RepID=A0ACD4C462_9BACI|nr:signal peptidase I [Rossellomorea vietnamensis]UXH43282.1 signal peptidase I [Rossellomorea vietnamensis]